MDQRKFHDCDSTRLAKAVYCEVRQMGLIDKVTYQRDDRYGCLASVRVVSPGQGPDDEILRAKVAVLNCSPNCSLVRNQLFSYEDVAFCLPGQIL